MTVRASISIWFFIGVLLFVYGGLITAYGGWELYSGHTASVTLARLHAPLWWGAVLFVTGVFYLIAFRPRPGR